MCVYIYIYIYTSLKNIYIGLKYFCKLCTRIGNKWDHLDLLSSNFILNQSKQLIIFIYKIKKKKTRIKKKYLGLGLQNNLKFQTLLSVQSKDMLYFLL